MSKQTAVEWLIQKLPINVKMDLGFEIIEQAQGMFEQQIIDACNQIDVIGPDHQQPGEQYYNKTYKQQTP